jgi:putative NADH-flavin reductase
MKVTVFGATGGTGRELVRQGLEQGHDVVAHVRDQSRIADVEHENLRVVCGDVLDEMSVEDGVAGQDAVMCAIGTGPGRTTLREHGTRNIISAMEQAGVRRLVCQSSLGVGDSRGNIPFFTKYVVIGIFLRHAFADHERQEAVVRESALDWIIVRPPHLKDGPRTGVYRHGFVTTDRSIAGYISRADVADFMVKQLSDDTYLRQSPGVSY